MADKISRINLLGSVYDIKDATAGKVDDVKVNGSTAVSNKVANITIPTKVSDLTNDASYYSKPNGGIPKTDLASTVQTSLGKADSALQSESDPVFSASAAASITTSDIANWNDKQTVTEETVAGWGFTKNTGTYSKPSGGIPKTDLASAVQTSLGLANTALQSFTETDPVFSASAASGIKSTDIANWNSKQSSISDLAAIRSGAALGATALQSFTEIDPTVPSWAKASNKPSYTASEVGAISSSVKGVANGVAELDANGKVPSSQLPSFVDDVLEYLAKSSFPTTGEVGKIYVDTSTNLTYRWSGTAYVEISPSLALGTTSSTAYRGDRGKIAYDHSQSAHAPSDAQKNVQSDWNATSGDALILNKPTIPTNTNQLTNGAGFITNSALGTQVTYSVNATTKTLTITTK